MRHLRRRSVLVSAVAITLAAAFHYPTATAQAGNPIQTVFVIIFENHNWSEILNNTAAPYINGLLGRASRAEAYFTPGGIHARTPNYLWLEAGQDFGLTGVSGFVRRSIRGLREKIWIASAPTARPRSGARAMFSAIETCAPRYIDSPFPNRTAADELCRAAALTRPCRAARCGELSR